MRRGQACEADGEGQLLAGLLPLLPFACKCCRAFSSACDAPLQAPNGSATHGPASGLYLSLSRTCRRLTTRLELALRRPC